MNPNTNRFEELQDVVTAARQLGYFPQLQEAAARVAERRIGTDPKLLRPDGSEVPKHWAIFKVGELVVIKDYTFKVAYINDGSILFEPVGPHIIGEPEPCFECALSGHCARHG